MYKPKCLISPAFALCWSEVGNYSSKEQYVSDLALSAIWEDSPDEEIPADRLEWLGYIWDVHQGGIPALRTITGHTQLSLSVLLETSQRNIENWCGKGKSSAKCPAYSVRMMAALMLPAPEK